MTRNEMINKLQKMAIAITGENSGKGTWDDHMAIWQLCLDWNKEHEEDEEIFMCECEHDADGNPTEYVSGFYIEDDYFIFEE